MSHFDRFAGIGIAKNRLDVYRRPDGLAFCVATTSDGVGRPLAKAGGGVAFGCEATGGYEDLLLVTLSQAGTPGYCLHPAGILAFARLNANGPGALDAKAVALALAAAVTARKPVVRTKDQSIIKELTALRRTLIISLSELKSGKARMRARPPPRRLPQTSGQSRRSRRRSGGRSRITPTPGAKPGKYSLDENAAMTEPKCFRRNTLVRSKPPGPSPGLWVCASALGNRPSAYDGRGGAMPPK